MSEHSPDYVFKLGEDEITMVCGLHNGYLLLITRADGKTEEIGSLYE
jgi:hypothetical protein